MQRFDYREPEYLATLAKTNLNGATNDALWLTATGRPGHNRAFVWVSYDREITAGNLSYWAGVLPPGPLAALGGVIYGQLPGTRTVGTPMPLFEQRVIGQLLTIPPGAGIAIAITGLVFRSTNPSNLVGVWWTSWSEAE